MGRKILNQLRIHLLWLWGQIVGGLNNQPAINIHNHVIFTWLLLWCHYGRHLHFLSFIWFSSFFNESELPSAYLAWGCRKVKEESVWFVSHRPGEARKQNSLPRETRETRLNREVHIPFIYSSNVYQQLDTVLGASNQISFGQAIELQEFSGCSLFSSAPRSKGEHFCSLPVCLLLM